MKMMSEIKNLQYKIFKLTLLINIMTVGQLLISLIFMTMILMSNLDVNLIVIIYLCLEIFSFSTLFLFSILFWVCNAMVNSHPAKSENYELIEV